MEKFTLEKFDLELLTNLKKLVLERPLIAFDLETTGKEIKTDEIVEIMAIKINLDGTHQEYYSKFNPTIPVHPEASKVNGLTTESLVNEPRFKDKVDEIYAFFLDCDLFAYNGLKFDIPMITEHFLNNGKKYNPTLYNIIDPYIVLFKKDPRTLGAIYQKYFGEEMETSHNATADIIASLRVYDKQVEMYNLSNQIKEVSDMVKSDNKGNTFVDFAGLIRYENNDYVYCRGKYENQSMSVDLSYIDWIVEKSTFPKYTRYIASLVKARYLKIANETKV